MGMVMCGLVSNFDFHSTSRNFDPILCYLFKAPFLINTCTFSLQLEYRMPLEVVRCRTLQATGKSNF